VTVIDVQGWSRALDVPVVDIGHALGATWANAEELYHLGLRQQIRLQDCPDLQLVAAVREVETAQCRVMTQLDEVLQVVRHEVG
jgi:hypothetical protein